jgi:hypothetical protein
MDRIHGAPLGGYGAPPEGYGAHDGMGAYTMEWAHGQCMDRSHGQESRTLVMDTRHGQESWTGAMDRSHGTSHG